MSAPGPIRYTSQVALTPPPISEVVQQLNRLLGESGLRGELDRNLRILAQSALSRLDLVNREEFDSQIQILARTRAGVEEMETRVAQLSEQLAALEAAQDR